MKIELFAVNQFFYKFFLYLSLTISLFLITNHYLFNVMTLHLMISLLFLKILFVGIEISVKLSKIVSLIITNSLFFLMKFSVIPISPVIKWLKNLYLQLIMSPKNIILFLQLQVVRTYLIFQNQYFSYKRKK